MTVRLLTIAEVLTQFEDMRNNGSLSVANRTALNRAYWILKDAEADEKIAKSGIRLVWQSQGEWIRTGSLGNGNAQYECSNCHYGDEHAEGQEVPYCWHCGAKMGKGGANDD